MLSYEEFKNKVEKEFLDHMPLDFTGFEVNVRAIRRVNESLDAISLRDRTEKEQVSPSLYINNMYEKYKQTEDADRVIDDYAKDYMKAMEASRDIPKITDELMRDNVIVQLINTEMNEELLKDIPHREFNDLSEVYRVVVKADQKEVQSFLVNNSNMERIGLTEPELNKLAMENTKRIFPITVRSMEDVLFGMLSKGGMTEADEKDFLAAVEHSDKTGMFVISNSTNMMGANCILYDEYLQQLAEKMETDMYILPSSVHEVIVVSTLMGTPESLSEMVTDINMSQVDLNERLSNQVYLYDKENRTLTMASNNPVKMLDGSDREESMQYGIAEEKASYR